jgi:hypothetical protein
MPPAQYVDVLADDENALAVLSTDVEVSAAFALSRAIHPEGGAFIAE